MAGRAGRVIAVVGATGLQGVAVTRKLLADGWRVRALTRDPDKKKVRSVVAPGAEVVRADTDDPGSLEPAFDGAYGVYNVQNHHVSGYEGEIRQGRNVTDVALRVGVGHVVYGAAGLGVRGTGVGSWDTKVAIAEYMNQRNLPVTILRPMAFMELMSASRFFPAASTWHVMPELMGPARPVGWLAADVQTMDQCRDLWWNLTGRPPRRFPTPLWLFERFVGADETTMWRWLRSNEFDLDTRPTLEVHPQALSVAAWLQRRTAPASRLASGRTSGRPEPGVG